MAYILQQLVNAIQLGSIYALIALGYNMVYGVLSLVNFAHGDIFMIGAFIAFFASTLLKLPFLPTLLLSMLGCAVLGVTIERLVYRPLRKAPKLSVVITALGVGLFLENMVLALLGPWRKSLPHLLPEQVYNVGGVRISTLQLIIIGVSIALMAILEFIVGKTKQGMAMRAISFDRFTVPLMGVPEGQIISLTFAIGSALAAAGGLLFSLAYPLIEPTMGMMVGWKAFIAAVIGGIGSIRGAMAGAFLLGLIEIAAGATFPSRLRDLIAFAVVWTILMIKPAGLFGVARREVV
ncbi:MAG: branched-chain amino acid ABC transporter permease [Chloroflexota bacterium]|nr:branched-chain amino acid ABC transporter permease [Chloroflexota bacterium]